MEEILKKIGQLQYEISCLELDSETLTGVTIRTEELKELVKNCSIPDVSKRFNYTNFQAGMYFGIIIMIIIFHIAIKTPAIK